MKKLLLVVLLIVAIGFVFTSCTKNCICTAKIELTDPDFVTSTDDVVTETQGITKSMCKKFEGVDTSLPSQIWTTTCKYE